VRSVRDAVEQLLLPAECLLCRALLPFRDSRRLVCAVCRHRWRPVRPPWCARCGQPEPHFGPCRLCAGWPPAFRSARDAAWLVPVPLGPGRLRARGYNQSERLARALGRRWGRPVVPLLVRVRDTATQTALTPQARLANVAGAFEMRNGECRMRNEGTPTNSACRIPNSAFERPLILVDDVFTTGATLAEAARALERAGATTVLAVTFGRAVVPDFT
jgi:predicted amidophosphoribosyltransferase